MTGDPQKTLLEMKCGRCGSSTPATFRIWGGDSWKLAWSRGFHTGNTAHTTRAVRYRGSAGLPGRLQRGVCFLLSRFTSQEHLNFNACESRSPEPRKTASFTDRNFLTGSVTSPFVPCLRSLFRPSPGELPDGWVETRRSQGIALSNWREIHAQATFGPRSSRDGI